MYKHLPSLLFLSISLNISAQDFSTDFLESLPSSLKDELTGDSQSSDEVDRLLKLDTSQENNQRILRSLKAQVDDLELRLLDEKGTTNNLPIFGESFFSSLQSTFMPINIPNFSDDYILNVGDSLNISFAGRGSSTSTEIFIERDGSILLPQYGKITIAGLSFRDASSLIRNFVNTKDIGSEAFISLSKLRDIQVILLGWVENPGIYTISAGSNIVGAINVAGGISKNGSYRSVRMTRQGKVQEYDLYDIFVNGDFDISHHLRSGDIIFVNPRGMNISISGGINKSAIYEILEEETLGDLIKFAGGMSPAYKDFNNVIIDRKNLDSSEILEVKNLEFDSFPLQERDSVLVPFYDADPIMQKTVSIEGMVKRPGRYFINDNSTMLDLIEMAGGFKDGAYEFGAALFRQQAIDIENIFSQKEYTETINYLVSQLGNPGSLVSAQAVDLIKEELKSTISTGRVIVDVNINKLRSMPEKNIKLSDGDRIVIPELNNIVYMVGEFNNPTSHTYDPNKSISDYIRDSGKLKETAEGLILVIDPDGTSRILQRNWFLVGKNNMPLYPGSIIYAPRDIANLSGIRYASAVAPILSSLAISLASLNSINN